MRYAWSCPQQGCTEPRPHAHFLPRPGAGADVVLDDPSGRRWYHPGHPVDPEAAAQAAARGLPVYRPADPVAIDQRPHLEYLARTEAPR